MPLILDSPPSTPPADDRAAGAAAHDERAERRRQHHEADIVIVGAGIAGCALAHALGAQGRSVALLERSLKQPDRIVGELLQPGGVGALRQLGLGDCVEGIDASVVEGYVVRYYGEPVDIPYAVDRGTEKRPQGRSFHHGRFVQKLREAAVRAPNVTVFETKATELVTSGYTGEVLGVECVTKGKKDYFFGHLTIVADGYSSVFRKSHHPHTPKVRSRFWGLELIDAELPRQQYGHVILSAGPPVLLYQIGSRETRALVDGPENLASARSENGGVKAHLRDVVVPALPECVRPAFRDAIERGGLRSMPNSFLPPATNRTPGLLIVGDAMNMRHPLTGGGMTVALNDALLLAELLAPAAVPSLSDSRLVLRQLKAFHWRRKERSSVINILAMALYTLFAADDSALRTLQRGCFRYFQRGGACVDDPVSLLGGVDGRPLLLVYHFFAVALYAIRVRLAEAAALAKPLVLVDSVRVLWTACLVIGPFVLSELRS